MRENWFCYNIVVIKIQKRSLIEHIPEPNSIAQNWSTLITGINACLYLPALMLTDIDHSGIIRISTNVPWVACSVVPEINTCDGWHATYAGCIWPTSFLCASARRQCYSLANCFLLLYIGFISLVLICSCSHCGMGVCCSVLGACTQACWAARELPEWTVVAFCTWSLIQRTKFFKYSCPCEVKYPVQCLHVGCVCTYIEYCCPLPCLVVSALCIILWLLVTGMYK